MVRSPKGQILLPKDGIVWRSWATFGDIIMINIDKHSLNCIRERSRMEVRQVHLFFVTPRRAPAKKLVGNQEVTEVNKVSDHTRREQQDIYIYIYIYCIYVYIYIYIYLYICILYILVRYMLYV